MKDTLERITHELENAPHLFDWAISPNLPITLSLLESIRSHSLESEFLAILLTSLSKLLSHEDFTTLIRLVTLGMKKWTEDPLLTPESSSQVKWGQDERKEGENDE